MKIKTVILNTVLVCLFFNLQAQDSSGVVNTLQEGGKLYAVIAIVLVILSGIFVFLFRIERQVQKIEEELKK
jgi:hypothetical protein